MNKPSLSLSDVEKSKLCKTSDVFGKYYLKVAVLSLFDHLKQDYCRYRQISSMQLSLRFSLALSHQEVIRIIILLKKLPKFPVNINDWVLFQAKLKQDLVTQMKM